MTKHITKGSIFDDLGFNHIEAENLKIRAGLMRAIEREIIKKKLTQAKAAKLLGVTQPRISNLMSGKIQLFTIDILINMLIKLNVQVSLVIDRRRVA